MVEIIKVKWGVSNYYSNPERIEINEKLYEPEFDDLKNRVLRHEMEHHKTKGFWKNRKIDALTDLKFSHLFKFFKKYPKTFFQQMSPINYSKIDKTLYFEWSLIFLYLLYAGILYGIFKLISLFSSNKIFFWLIVKKAGIILLIIFALYYIGKSLKKYINEESRKLSKKK